MIHTCSCGIACNVALFSDEARAQVALQVAAFSLVDALG